MQSHMSSLTESTLAVLSYVALKVVGAIILWIIGRWLIKFAVNLMGRALDRQNLDRTLVTYIKSGVGVLLNVILIVALLGFFGVQTTTFAALLAGVGIAVGAAWSGLLSNLAAGVFLVTLRPFQVGDIVSVAGISGTVREIGLFSTTINTFDNVSTIVGNGKIFSEIIQNFSTNDYRRVDLQIQLSHDIDPRAAIAVIQNGLRSIQNVLVQPAPDVEILECNFDGPILVVRPYCRNTDYWQVYFDVNRFMIEKFREIGFPIPEKHYAIHGNLDIASDENVAKAA